MNRVLSRLRREVFTCVEGQQFDQVMVALILSVGVHR